MKQPAVIKLLIVLLVSIIFVGLRLYQLPEKLLFYNDIGRDYVVLREMAVNLDPPLLGPQTSVLSYNQSAWYFYLLFPVFVISGHSAFASTITLTLVALGIYWFLAWQTRRQTKIFLATTITFLLLAIHPQTILQNRFIWNPSFVPYFLFASLVAAQQLAKQYNRLWLLTFWLSLAFAVGFSYSAVPLAVLLSGYVLFTGRKHWKGHLITAATAALVVLAPLILFELRHNFALTRLLFVGQTTPQAGLALSTKISLLRQYLVPASQTISSEAQLGLLAILMILSATISKHTFFIKLLVALVLLAASYLVLPITIEKHYIFPLVVLLFFTLAYMPIRMSILAMAVFGFAWLSPANRQLYLADPPRTVSEMQSCYQSICQQVDQPLYVSMESSILPGYHNAPEHRFFLAETGCQVFDIEQHQDQANHMLVINDGGNFDPGNSGYRELTLFGEYTVANEFSCTDHLSALLLEKSSEATEGATVYQPQ